MIEARRKRGNKYYTPLLPRKEQKKFLGRVMRQKTLLGAISAIHEQERFMGPCPPLVLPDFSPYDLSLMTEKELTTLRRSFRLGSKIQTGIDTAKLLMENVGKEVKRRGWKEVLGDLALGLEEGRAPFGIFQEGNSKLPYWNFGTLPIFTCPGMGDCGNWCYSFRAWKYPASLAKQLQNTLLLKFNPHLIRDAFLKLPQGVVLRLYTDGDFGSEQDVRFWMDLLKTRPDINAYGYSKSWDELYSWGSKNTWPSNYMLNLSSGGKERKVTREQMASLPITRGQFVAVEIDRPQGIKGDWGFKKYAERTYHVAVRQAAKEQGHTKVFSCPGTCRTCTPQGHACGLKSMKDVVIAIGIH
jgi:hypothetical protein